VTLRADVTPAKAKCRRLAPVFQVYLEGHMEELVKFGLMYLNNDSQWSSAPRIVAKKEPGAYRMTVDLRAVNALTVRPYPYWK
jgi:hypothetical protein